MTVGRALAEVPAPSSAVRVGSGSGSGPAPGACATLEEAGHVSARAVDVEVPRQVVAVEVRGDLGDGVRERPLELRRCAAHTVAAGRVRQRVELREVVPANGAGDGRVVPARRLRADRVTAPDRAAQAPVSAGVEPGHHVLARGLQPVGVRDPADRALPARTGAEVGRAALLGVPGPVIRAGHAPDAGRLGGERAIRARANDQAQRATGLAATGAERDAAERQIAPDSGDVATLVELNRAEREHASGAARARFPAGKADG